MRIFVTGATGFVGSAVVKELTGAGHGVLGLVRTDTAADALAAQGATAHRGSLEDLDSLRTGAAAADAVIHTAFIHDFSKLQENCDADQRAIEALGSALAGTDRPLIVTSGLALLASGALATEDDNPLDRSVFPRVSEQTAASFGSRGVRPSVIRLPPSVHGDGDHGFVPILIGIARQTGVSAYVGDGQNRWSAVHRLDAGRLYRLAVENGSAGRYHGVAEQAIPFRQIAEVIGRRLNVPVVSKSPDEAAGHFGWFARFAAMDFAASSAQTREHLGWHPTQPSLLADIDRPTYFN